MCLATEITKKGNAVGFTARGETVTGCYLPKSKAWRVTVVGPEGVAGMADCRNRNFATRVEAAEYATTLTDPAKTTELKWW